MREFDINSVREDFPILDRRVYGRPLVYLDNAATAQKPLRVLDAIGGMYREQNANIHRGVHYLSEESTAMYEAARETVREFIGAASREEIVFTSGATASLNTAAFGLCELLVGEGDNVIVSEMEHHSNIVPWQMAAGRQRAQLRVLPFNDAGELEIGKLSELIDSRTRVLALTQCSNVLGSRPDIKKAVQIAHEHGVKVVVDGCQGVVHGGADVRDMDCDLYAFSGHKLYGPTGTGVLYGKKDILEAMPPFMGGGDMVNTVSFEKTTWAELPLKFEAGTANYIDAVGMAEAIRYLGEFDPADVERHEQALLDAATARLMEIDGLRIYGTTADKAPIVSFSVEGVHPYDMGMILDKQGVAIRTGTHCAQPLMAHYGLAGMCRASFALYNTLAEVEVFVEGVKKAVSMLRR
jgi:cysteine desulfurase/selenocysteine lyase